MTCVLLVGAGPMAQAYLSALRITHPGVSVQVAGRSAESAARFAAQTGVTPTTGPLAEQLVKLDREVKTAIVAVQVDLLPAVTKQLLDAGFERVLLEKPGAPTVEQAADLAKSDPEDRIRIAYNRRFLTSSQYVRRAIEAEGGVTSFSFEFTEVEERIAATRHAALVKANWALANSSHVMDMAFDLAGGAEDLSDVIVAAALSSGHIDWHPRGARFAGCGSVGDKTLFSYTADWKSGGGWAVELVTAERRFIMRPLETVIVQPKGSFTRSQVDVPAEEAGLKPGLPGMLRCFLDGDQSAGSLPTAREQARRMALFDSLLGSQSRNSSAS